MNKYLILGLILVFASLLVLPGVLANPPNQKYCDHPWSDCLNDHPWGGDFLISGNPWDVPGDKVHPWDVPIA